jgi:hypothetical protein
MTDDKPHGSDHRVDGSAGPVGTMPPSRFEMLIDAYGAAVERWPEEERAAALALLARSPAARAARDAAARLDALLDVVPAEPPSAALAERVLAARPVPVPAANVAGAYRRRRGLGGRVAAVFGQIWPGAPAWQPVTALATALLLGLVVGYTQPPFDTDAIAVSGEGTELLAFGAVSEPEVSP